MALQTSGAISLNDIAGEFGGAVPHSLNEYYGVAPGIPSSGTISISNFYGASNLSVPTQPTGTTTWQAYNSGTVTSPTLDFGTAYAERRILVICNNEENAPTSVSSVTVGGVVATRLATRSDWSGSYGSTASIWFATVPSGTSGTVVANKSLGRIAVKILILKGGDATLVTSGVTGASFQTSTTPVITLSSVTNSVSLATACNTSAGGGGSCTWTATRTGTLNSNDPKYGYALSNSVKTGASDTLTCSVSALTFKGRNNAVSCVAVAVR